MTQEELRQLVAEVQRRQGELDNVEVKTTRAVMARCGWCRDDCSPRVENLPKAPPEPGQLPLFSERAEP
jgi:hypothetical protein